MRSEAISSRYDSSQVCEFGASRSPTIIPAEVPRDRGITGPRLSPGYKELAASLIASLPLRGVQRRSNLALAAQEIASLRSQ